VAGLAWRVRQVDVATCHGERPPRHRLAAVRAQIAGPVALEAPFTLCLVRPAVPALRSRAVPPHTRSHGHSTFSVPTLPLSTPAGGIPSGHTSRDRFGEPHSEQGVTFMS